jgi:hypothetical protein
MEGASHASFDGKTFVYFAARTGKQSSMDVRFWPSSVDHDQQPGQPQPAQAVNQTGICS